MNWEKYVLCWEKLNFKSIMNSAHTAELLALRKVLNKNIDYLMYYLSRQHVKWKLKVYIQNNDFMKNKELNLCKF